LKGLVVDQDLLQIKGKLSFDFKGDHLPQPLRIGKGKGHLPRRNKVARQGDRGHFPGADLPLRAEPAQRVELRLVRQIATSALTIPFDLPLEGVHQAKPAEGPRDPDPLDGGLSDI